MADEVVRGRVEADVSGYKRGMEEAARATDGFRREAEAAAKGGAERLRAGMDAATSATERFRRQAEEAAQGGVRRLGSGVVELAVATAALAGVASLGALTGRLVSVQRQFDVLNSSLVTVTGGSEEAERAFAWIKEFAATTPYALAEVTEAFVRMKALGLDASREALVSYGNTASAMGKSLNQMIEAVADASTGEFERLKEFGIRARQERDQVTLTFRGVETTVRNSSEEIVRYLRRIGEEDFGGAMAERAKTLDGALSNLGDTWDELFRTVNAAGVGQVIYDSVALATQGVQNLINNVNALRSYWQQTEQQQVDGLVAERQRWEGSLSRAKPGSFQAIKAKEAIEEINGEIRKLQESFERQAQVASVAAVKTEQAVKPVAAAIGKTGAVAKEAGDAIERLLLELDADAVAEAARAVDAYHRAWAQHLNGLDEQRRGLEEQVELYGLTEAQIAAVTLRRAEETLEVARANGVAADYLAALAREVALRREIAGAAGTLEAKRANAEAAQTAAREWERTAQEIEGAIYDAIVGGGQDAGEVLERTFKALVLRPIIQPIAQAAAGVVQGALGFGSSGASGSGSSGLGAFQGALSGFNTVGSALGLGAAAGFSSIAQAGIGGWLSASGSLIGTGTLGGIGAGVGMLAGPVGAALALGSVLGVFDKKPSDKTSWGTVDARTGALSVGSMTGKKDPGQEQRDATARVLGLLGGFAADVGLSGLGVSIGGRDGVRMSVSGGFRSPAGGLNKFGEVTYGGAGDVEGALRRMLDDIVDEGTLPQKTIDAWKQMRTDAAGAARDAQEQVDVLDLLTRGINQAEIERANTMQQAGETLAAAYARMVEVENSIRAAISQTFDTPAEQLAAAFEAMNTAIPQTLEQYEALVRAQDLTTEAGRNQAVALLNAKGAWDVVQREQEAAAEAARRAAEEARRAWEALQNDLSAFRVELTAGALAGLSPEAAYAAAQTQFADTSRLAGLGNQDALAGLAEAGRALLAASEAYNARTGAYFADRDRVLSAVDAGVALTGRKIEGFANGTSYFGGGLRIVGERGPELEATGPARIWNAQQTQAMLGGGGEAVRELQAVVRVLSTGLSSIDRRLANLERHGEEQARAARLAADRRPGDRWAA